MNREDIIRMAKEAGFQYLESFTDDPEPVYAGDELGSLTKFAQLVAAHEREEILGNIMSDQIKKFPLQEKISPKAGELARRLHELVHEYDGEISTSEAVGALEIVKYHILKGACDE